MKRVTAAIIVITIMAVVCSVNAKTRTSSSRPKLPDPILWLKCDMIEENQIKDQSGNENNAEVKKIKADDLKKVGSTRVMVLKGDSFVSIPSSESLLLANKDFSIGMWVKPSSVDDKDMVLLAKWASDSAKEYGITILQGGQVCVEMESGGNDAKVTTQSEIKSGEWTHIVVTASAENIRKGSDDAVKIYLDRRQAQTEGKIKKLPKDSKAAVCIGRSSESSDDGYVGQIDDIRMFDSEFTSKDVGMLWRNAPSIEMRR